jgi:peptidyl-prolyl cis-trans isomerase A (cyclophilin A)
MKRSLPRLLLAAVLYLGLNGIAAATGTCVLMKTTLGDIELELDTVNAPLSSQNFLRYVDEGFYQGTIFHRVINSFMIQGGGFTVDLEKKPTHGAVRNEAKNGLKNERGTIAMARTNRPHSATSQFFINHVDNEGLDHPGQDGWGYAVFGRVTNGMETVDRIADVYTVTRGVNANVPEEPVLIESVTRLPDCKQ